jgi:hypothetical protein
MRGLKTWLTCGYLAVVLALAGCAANPVGPRTDNFDQQTWNSISVPQPSGEHTDMQLWVDMHGGP